jgi:hypothetical protein
MGLQCRQGCASELLEVSIITVLDLVLEDLDGSLVSFDLIVGVCLIKRFCRTQIPCKGMIQVSSRRLRSGSHNHQASDTVGVRVLHTVQ